MSERVFSWWCSKGEKPMYLLLSLTELSAILWPWTSLSETVGFDLKQHSGDRHRERRP